MEKQRVQKGHTAFLPFFLAILLHYYCCTTALLWCYCYTTTLLLNILAVGCKQAAKGAMEAMNENEKSEK
jgi:hypothetical protein